jgi:hypothetical protein
MGTATAKIITMQKEQTYRLLCLLSFINCTPAEQEETEELIKQEHDWTIFYDLAVLNKIIPMAYYRLLEGGWHGFVPAWLWQKMEAETAAIRNKNQRRNAEALRFLEAFDKQQIPVALLKGVALAETVYQNPAYKRMNDIDILIQKKDREAIYEIYRRLDYFFIGERIAGAPEKSDKVSHLAPPFVSRNYDCVIGTQWGIKTPLGPYTIDYDGIWKRAIPLRFYGIPVHILSPADNLHHLCLHLGYFKISLRDLMDIYNLLHHTGTAFDWNLFETITKESRSWDPVYFALGLAQHVRPLPAAGAFLQHLSPMVTSRTKKALQWKTRSMEVFLHLHSDHIQTIEKNISAFDATGYLPEKWQGFVQLWKNVLAPPREEAMRMSALYQPSALQLAGARLTLPFKILRVIAGEIGWTLTIGLMFKTVFDLLKTVWRFPFTKRNHNDCRAYARRLGIPYEHLQKLQQEFQ